MSNEPTCVRRVDTIEEAQLLVAWLDDNDIDATIVGGQNPGSLAFGVSDFTGIRIFVSDDSTAARAMELLAEHDDQQAGSAIRQAGSAGSPENASAEPAIEMTCEECGVVTMFEGAEKNKVQTCSACGAFIDIPDEASTA